MSRSSWNWSDRLALPSVLLVAEASWVSLAIDGALTHLRVSIGLPGVILPGLAEIALVGIVSSIGLSRWFRLAIILFGGFAVAGVSAGLIAAARFRLLFATVAFEPWRIHDPRVIALASVSWVVALASGARGLTLATWSVSYVHAIRSAIVGFVAYVLVFVVDTVDSESALQRAIGSMLVPATLFLVLATSGVFLTRRREIEGLTRLRTSSRATSLRDGANLAVVCVTAALVLLVTVLSSVAAPLLGRGLASVVRALESLWPHIPAPRTTSGGHKGSANCLLDHPPCHFRSYPVAPHTPGSSVGIAILVFVLLAVTVLAIFLVRFRRGHRRSTGLSTEDSATDSIFTWRHLFAQFWAWLRGLFARKLATDGDIEFHPNIDFGNENSVRGQYRRLMAATRKHGVSRGQTETVEEFTRRSSRLIASCSPDDLGQSARIYELVRYGERGDAEFIGSMTSRVDRLIEILEGDGDEVRA